MAVPQRIKALAKKEYSGVKSVVMAFSGGLDSCAIVSMFQELGIEVTTVSVDLGQQGGNKKPQEAAKKLGTRHQSIDGKEDLYLHILKGIKANCLIDSRLNAGGLSRPLLAKYLSEVAHKEHTHAIAHGSSGVGNEQLRLENSLRVLAPECRILAPVRDLDMKRDETIAYAKAAKLPIDIAAASPYSVDETFWARVIRQGEIPDATQPVPESAFSWTNSPKAAPEKGAKIEMEFLDGVPAHATNLSTGENASGIHVIPMLNSLGGAHAIGRIDKINDKVIGLKVREVTECPAAFLLINAHQRLEHLVMTEKEIDAKSYVDRSWNKLVSQGFWYSRLRRWLDAFIDESQRPVDGRISFELYKGNSTLLSRSSPNALYDQRLSSRSQKGVWNQKEARHFAKIYGLQETLAFIVENR